MIPIILKMHCFNIPTPESTIWKGGVVLSNLGIF